MSNVPRHVNECDYWIHHWVAITLFCSLIYNLSVTEEYSLANKRNSYIYKDISKTCLCLLQTIFTGSILDSNYWPCRTLFYQSILRGFRIPLKAYTNVAAVKIWNRKVTLTCTVSPQSCFFVHQLICKWNGPLYWSVQASSCSCQNETGHLKTWNGGINRFVVKASTQKSENLNPSLFCSKSYLYFES